MNNTFPSEIGHYYRPDLAIKIAKELGHINAADPDFEKGCPSYNVTDIFNILPSSIRQGTLIVAPEAPNKANPKMIESKH